MPRDFTVELATKDVGDWKYEVGSWFDDRAIVADGYSSMSATCDEVAAIADRLRKTFPGVAILVSGPGIDCLKTLPHTARSDGQAIRLAPFDSPLRFT